MRDSRIDDIFEAMTDIDDRFIEAARPLEPIELYGADQVVPVKSAPRRALWKTLVPAAAFVAVVAAAGVVGVNYLRRGDVRTNVASSISNCIAYRYPDEAKYIVDSNINTLIWSYPSGSPSWIDDRVDYAYSYEELAEQSDLIVSGTFIDDIHQTQDSNHTIVADGVVDSYNMLEIERVIKGDVSVGNSLIIHQSSVISRNTPSDYEHLIFCLDQLSPMLKGDKWIYFLKLEEDGTFSPVNGPQGRYPLPDYTNRLISSDGETPNVDEFSTYENAAPAREKIYEELLKKLAEANTPKIEQIGVPGESFTTFEMEEFPDVEFYVSRLGVTANIDVIMESRDIFDMYEDETLANLFLADLNSDGKRELCVTIGGSSSHRVAVYDYANELSYTLGDVEYFLKGDSGYSLSIGKGTVYTTSDINNEPVWIPKDNEVLLVNRSVWHSADLLTTETNELTLDMMRLVDTSLPLWEVPLLSDNTFKLPDFEGFVFEVDTNGVNPKFYMSWNENGFVTLNPVNEVYFYDLDGDGQREIVMNCLQIDDGCIKVYGFTDNGEFGEAVYYEDGGCRVVESDGTLKYKAENSGERAFEFSKSELVPVFKRGYSDELLSWDHSLNFKGVVPASAFYNIRIENRTLLIDYNGEIMFDSGHTLGELYYIADKENNSLTFIFTNENDGTVGALKISEKSRSLYRFDENITLKPTADDLLIVREDGTEEPFVFPDDEAQTIVIVQG